MADELFDENLKESETKTAKCPSCGAELIYSPDTKGLVCPYCGASKEVDFNHFSSEIDIDKMFNESANEWGRETHIFSCNNCGAKVVLDKNEIATDCPFCGTTNIVESSEIVGLKPNGIVPYMINENTASDNSLSWAKKRFFAPRKFKKSVTPKGMIATYLPAFTFDSDTDSTYSGRLGETHYRTVTKNGKTTTVKETKYFNIRGTYKKFFNDILIHASDKINQKSLNKMAPFNTDNSQAYSLDFLHGYRAEVASRSGKDCFNDAKKVMDSEIRRGILAQYTYDVVDYLNVNTSFYNSTFKYLLLPVYIGHYIYKEKNYNFFVNGYNGKVTGKTPLSPIRISILVLFILAILALILYLVYIS